MSVSGKVIILVILFLFALQHAKPVNSIAQEKGNHELRISHHVGELRKVNISRILTQSLVEINDDSQEVDKKIIVYEMSFAETCIEIDDENIPKRLFLKILKNRRKKDVNSSDADTEMQALSATWHYSVQSSVIVRAFSGPVPVFRHRDTMSPDCSVWPDSRSPARGAGSHRRSP